VLIPARSGSKRLPGKNKRPLLGIPLVNWTIKTALSVFNPAQVILSTDDPDVQLQGKKLGLRCDRLRPCTLADDDADLVDVAEYELRNLYGQRDITPQHVILLQPTSPLRLPESILGALALYEQTGSRPIVGCTRVISNRKFLITNEKNNGLNLRVGSAKLDSCESFAITGLIYVSSIQHLRLNRTFSPAGFRPFFPRIESENIDIDTEKDFLEAERAVKTAALKCQVKISENDAHSLWLNTAKEL
jgi:CMP-N,N'-diacetyllegionaminic acid synthase